MMNRQRVLWGVMMLCGAVLLLSRAQSLSALSIAGEQLANVERGGPEALTALGALEIGVGGSHTCVVTTLGGAQCWGCNSNGQLGNNSTTDSPIPVNVCGLTSGVTVIAAGYDHSCAVAGGAVKCWGHNYYGQVGNGYMGFYTMPIDVLGLLGQPVPYLPIVLR